MLHGGVQLGVEADSLNCSILGPDVTSSDPEFDLFVKGVVTEMTVKAGQKCTAIRRVDRAGGRSPTTVTEAIAARLAKITVGNPADEDVRMGALACLDQREEVRKAVQALRASADVVFGDPDHVDVVDGDAERGAFMSPVLLRATRGRGRAARRRAVRPGLDRAHLRRPRRGRRRSPPAARAAWSARSSPTTRTVARTVVLGLAPWHGRILVLDRDDAAESTGHGSPLPMLVHGGPGRAGGGEELGGIRGVLHHMQRTAIQASPDMLTAITGRWTTGSQRTRDATCTRSARASPTLRDRRHDRLRVAHGSRSTTSTTSPSSPATPSTPTPTPRRPRRTRSSAASSPTATSSCRWRPGCSSTPTPGPVLANFGVDNLRFLTPVKAGDSIAVTLTVKQITPRTKRRLRRGPLGRAGHQRATASRSRRTTC